MLTTKQRIQFMRSQGFTVRQMSRALGISTQAVYKHIKSLDGKRAGDAA